MLACGQLESALLFSISRWLNNVLIMAFFDEFGKLLL